VALVEGVTPADKALRASDIKVSLQQYGGVVTLSDVVLDTKDCPVLRETVSVLGQQAAEMVEKMRFGVFKAGTNVVFPAGATSRATVAAGMVLSLDMQRAATKRIKRQNGRPVTKVLRSTPRFWSQPVAPSMIGFVHPDLESQVRSIPGFVPTEEYGETTPYENELGKVEDVRYLTSTIIEPFYGAGAAAIDVYPVLYMASRALGIVALKGKGAITPMVHNPIVSDSDKLAQRGHAGWKSMQAAVILNDCWLIRCEVSGAL
jgi:N4-gp56 family major capsid protein